MGTGGNKQKKSAPKISTEVLAALRIFPNKLTDENQLDEAEAKAEQQKLTTSPAAPK